MNYEKEINLLCEEMSEKFAPRKYNEELFSYIDYNTPLPNELVEYVKSNNDLITKKANVYIAIQKMLIAEKENELKRKLFYEKNSFKIKNQYNKWYMFFDEIAEQMKYKSEIYDDLDLILGDYDMEEKLPAFLLDENKNSRKTLLNYLIDISIQEETELKLYDGEIEFIEKNS